MTETTITIDHESITFRGPFRCVGSVRGSCGKNHRTIDAARKHCGADQKICKSQGGYSDRNVTDRDGQIVPDFD